MARSSHGNPFIMSALRQVRDTLPRFLSILLITMIGVAFFSGLRLTGPYMKYSAEEWLDDRNFMDIQIFSTIGFDDADIEALRNTEGISQVNAGYHTNVLLKLRSSEVSVQFLSLGDASAGNTGTGGTGTGGTGADASTGGTATSSIPVNFPELVSGRYPEKPNECLAEESWLRNSRTTLDSAIQITSGNANPISDRLVTDTFIIVGTAKSPLYIAEDRGTSEIGSGTNSYYFLVLPSAFTFELYTVAYLQADLRAIDSEITKGSFTFTQTTAGPDNRLPISRFNNDYFTVISFAVKQLEKTGELRLQERYDKIMSDGKKELEDARIKVADGHKELDDARKELDDARKKLDDGWADLEDGRKALEDGQATLNDSRRELDDGWAELFSGWPEIAEGWAALETSRIQLDDAWVTLNDARTQLDDAWEELEAGRIQLEESRALLESMRDLLDVGWEQYWQSYESFLDAEANNLYPPYILNIMRLLLNATLLGLEYSEEYYASSLEALEEGEAEYQRGLAEWQQYEDEYQTGLAELIDGEAEYQSGLEKLRAGEASYWDGYARLERGEASYRDGLAELEEAEAKYLSGLEDWLEGKAEYEDGLATFEKEYATAIADLKQAEKDIEKGEKDLAAFKFPRWYVLDLQSNTGFRSYKEESEQIEAISRVIPLLFFLIAALVSMTCMTRLVDKDRTIIGTYKALGYTNRAITMRYLLYAFSATLAGGIIGVIVGYNLFPPLIFNAFHTLFTIPPAAAIFSWPYALISISFALFSTVVPAGFICLGILRETPASAMRPLAPRPGKRIALEYVRPLWKRLSFLHKVTARNLFRYKKRALMTIIGVAGCTALMFTGFGLNDSLSTLGPKQYGEIQRFDVAISFKPSSSPEQLNALFAYLDQTGDLSSTMLVSRETADILGEIRNKNLAIVVPSDPENFNLYLAMQSPPTGLIPRPAKQYTLSNEGILLSEQIASQYNVSIGSTITLRTLDNNEAEFKVVGIVENYVYHHAIMTPAVYEQAFGHKSKPNQIIGLFAPGSKSLPVETTDLEMVTGVLYTQRLANGLSSMTDVLGFVMAILIASAALQAFVVLFSLNTINREERMRELASIKVLGFFNRELATYVYREGLILTLVAIVLGLFLGIGLQRYIITTIEVDVFMFSRDLLYTSYLYSSLLTMLFAAVVNLLLYRPTTHIDMVSSLKAVE